VFPFTDLSTHLHSSPLICSPLICSPLISSILLSALCFPLLSSIISFLTLSCPLYHSPVLPMLPSTYLTFFRTCPLPPASLPLTHLLSLHWPTVHHFSLSLPMLQYPISTPTQLPLHLPTSPPYLLPRIYSSILHLTDLFLNPKHK
jgi:hypothetical protein